MNYDVYHKKTHDNTCYNTVIITVITVWGLQYLSLFQDYNDDYNDTCSEIEIMMRITHIKNTLTNV